MVLLLYYFFLIVFWRFLLSKPSDLILGMRNDEKPPPEAETSPSYEWKGSIVKSTLAHRSLGDFLAFLHQLRHPVIP